VLNKGKEYVYIRVRYVKINNKSKVRRMFCGTWRGRLHG